MLVRLRLFALVVIALVCGASPLRAQGGASVNPAPATAARPAADAQAGPRLDASVTAARRLAQPLDSTVVLQQRQNVGQPIALMVVGGAAIILGALIGDDVGAVFMIGGAIALLIGLYKYLN